MAGLRRGLLRRLRARPSLCLAAAILAVPLLRLDAGAAEISTAPYLRIDTGMHEAAIDAVAIDEADHQIVTASDDKTVRLWSETSGDLAATLRAPIGDGPEGGLYAVALSPSGKTIATGGYSGISWDGSASIYLYNRQDGSWLGRIALGAGTDAINHLAFSHDGRYLAVATNDSHGLRILDTTGRSLKIVDSDYADAIEWLDFAADGRLVTTSLDGQVRLYGADFKRIAAAHVPAGQRPLAVAFSPDGNEVAVGLLGNGGVLLLSGRDLKPLGERKGGSGRQGALSVVAWSADGAALYGAGTYSDPQGRKLVRKWSAADPGKASDIEVSDDTVTGLAALKAGGVAFVSAEPAWGVIAGDDKVALRHDRVHADFRDGDRAFAVSADGALVDFGFKQGGNARARFNVVDGTLELNPAGRADMKPPATGGLADWRNSAKPRLDGHVMPLDENEQARSGAVLGDRALIGTDYFLRAYKGGGATWRTAVPAPVWTVNIAADGRLAVAGLGDGTIRWYRLADGALVLSLFAEPDGKHWVLWTPEGFFDHGEGGDQLIGYQLNQLDQGRPHGSVLVRVEQLYGLFFRRDLVVKKFLGNAESEVAAQLKEIGDVRTVLGRGLPPDIRLSEYCFGANCTKIEAGQEVRGISGKVNPQPAGGPEVTLHFAVTDRGGGIGPIVVRNRFAAVAASGQTRGVQGNVHEEERVVKLQPGLNLIGLSAFNSADEIETEAKERPALALHYDASVVQKPVMRLISVGIDNYRGKGVPKLANAAADAKGVADVMRGDKKHDVFADVDAVVLTDQDATLANIDKAFDDLALRTKPDDLVFVFLAGHGVALDGKYFYIPSDLPDTEDDSIRHHALTYDDLAAHLAKFPTARAVVILDTCYSGAFAVDDSILRDSRDQTVGKQISHATGRFILAGSSSQQEALDGVDGHGVFTEVLLRGLSGDADTQTAGNHDGHVSIFELGEYAKSQVPQLAAKIAKGYNQKPRWFFNGDEMFDLRDDN